MKNKRLRRLARFASPKNFDFDFWQTKTLETFLRNYIGDIEKENRDKEISNEKLQERIKSLKESLVKESLSKEYAFKGNIEEW